MTLDERMNDLEDQIRKMKLTINENNRVARRVKTRMDDEMAALSKRVQALESAPNSQVAFDDIINNAMKNKGAKP